MVAITRPQSYEHGHPWRERLQPGAFAVLVNANARGINRRTLRLLNARVPEGDLYLSRSLEQSQALVEQLVAWGYEAIFACGGDGTFSQLLNDLRRAEPRASRRPRVGVLRMGTGNGFADSLRLGAMRPALEHLTADGAVDVLPVRMVEAAGEVCPFAGLGYDAAVLADYNRLKGAVRDTPLQRALTGVRGYLAAGVLHTAPRLLREAMPRVTVRNEGSVAFQIDARGRVQRRFERGDVLYDGPASMAAVGVVPFIGHRMRMFPCASMRPGFLQLRVANMGPMQAVRNLGKIWRGAVGAAEGVSDFHVQRVRFELDRDAPLQISGDARGVRRAFEAGLSREAFELARPVLDGRR